MSETKFTPGPWKIALDSLNEPPVLSLPNYIDIDAPRHAQLAQVVWKMDDDVRSPVQEANAHLIAAAPELYEALERILAAEDAIQYGVNSDNRAERYSELAKTLINGRAALAKARGK